VKVYVFVYFDNKLKVLAPLDARRFAVRLGVQAVSTEGYAMPKESKAQKDTIERVMHEKKKDF
jgi:hypothetical protein